MFGTASFTLTFILISALLPFQIDSQRTTFALKIKSSALGPVGTYWKSWSGLEKVQECVNAIYGGPTPAFMIAFTKTPNQVYTWGKNALGQFGNGQVGDSTWVSEPYALDMAWFEGETVVDVSCGSYFSMALTAEGSLFYWGSTSSNTNTNFSLVPIRTMTNVSKLYGGTGLQFGVALTNGSFYFWGTDFSWQNCNVFPSPAWSGSLLIKTITTGITFPSILTYSPSQIQSLTLGWYSGYALTLDGAFLGWGESGGHLGLSASTGYCVPVMEVNVSGKVPSRVVHTELRVNRGLLIDELGDLYMAGGYAADSIIKMEIANISIKKSYSVGISNAPFYTSSLFHAKNGSFFKYTYSSKLLQKLEALDSEGFDVQGLCNLPPPEEPILWGTLKAENTVPCQSYPPAESSIFPVSSGFNYSDEFNSTDCTMLRRWYLNSTFVVDQLIKANTSNFQIPSDTQITCSDDPNNLQLTGNASCGILKFNYTDVYVPNECSLKIQRKWNICGVEKIQNINITYNFSTLPSPSDTNTSCTNNKTIWTLNTTCGMGNFPIPNPSYSDQGPRQCNTHFTRTWAVCGETRTQKVWPMDSCFSGINNCQNATCNSSLSSSFSCTCPSTQRLTPNGVSCVSLPPGQAKIPVVPYLECYEDSGPGTYVAYFGYSNEFKAAPANQNTITPQSNRATPGLPSIFEQKRKFFNFFVEFQRSVKITWTVEGVAISAPPAGAGLGLCPDSLDITFLILAPAPPSPQAIENSRITFALIMRLPLANVKVRVIRLAKKRGLQQTTTFSDAYNLIVTATSPDASTTGKTTLDGNSTAARAVFNFLQVFDQDPVSVEASIKDSLNNTVQLDPSALQMPSLKPIAGERVTSMGRSLSAHCWGVVAAVMVCVLLLGVL